jgi:hypothetical protein
LAEISSERLHEEWVVVGDQSRSRYVSKAIVRVGRRCKGARSSIPAGSLIGIDARAEMVRA